MDSNQNKIYCSGGRHYSQTLNQIVYEKINPKTNKLVETIKGS